MMKKHKNTIMAILLLTVALIVSGCCGTPLCTGSCKIDCDCDNWLKENPSATCKEFRDWLDTQDPAYKDLCQTKGPCANQRAATTTQ